MKLIAWYIVLFGIVEIIVNSKIFKPFRELFNITTNKYSKPWHQIKFKIDARLYQLLNCEVCMSVWVGGLLSIFWWSPIHFIYGATWIFLDSMFAAGLMELTLRIENAIMEK